MIDKVILVIFASNLVYAGPACLTPNGSSGKCLPLTECKNLYENAQRKPDSQFGYTSDSSCGWWIQPHVCCSEDTEYSLKYHLNLPKTCGFWDGNGDPPWLMQIEIDKQTCVGVLIAENYVITKASCLTHKTKDIKVKLENCREQSNDDCTYRVSENKIFPVFQYLKDGRNDIALLKLSGKVTGAMPLCIYEEEITLNDDVLLVTLEKSNTRNVFQLQANTLHLDKCKEHNGQLKKGEFCASLPSKHCSSNNWKGGITQYLNSDEKWYLFGQTKFCSAIGNIVIIDSAVYHLKWIKSNIS